jgi:hypothetical protein
MSALVPEQDKLVIDVSGECYDEIRSKLIALGTGGTIIERGGGVGKVIDMGEIVIRTRYAARHATTETK